MNTKLAKPLGWLMGIIIALCLSAIMGINASASTQTDITSQIVTGVTATEVTDKTVTLSWTQLESAQGYVVYSTDAQGEVLSQIGVIEENTSSYLVAGLSVATQYYFKVSAYTDVDGGRVDSQLSDNFAVCTKPSQVQNFKATASTTDSVTFIWNTLSASYRYKIMYVDSKGSLRTVTTLSGDKGTYTAKNLTPGTKYTFVIFSYIRDAANTVVFSQQSSNVSICTYPAQLTGLIAKAATTDSITLTWTKVSGANLYRIYRYNPTTKKYQWLKTINTNTYVDSGLTMATSYKYRVAPVTYVDGVVYQGKYNSDCTLDTKIPATTVRDLRTTMKRNVLFWTKVSDASGYEIYRHDAVTGKYIKIRTITTNSQVSFSDNSSALKLNTRYTYKIVAYKTVGSHKYYSVYSNSKFVTPRITICVDPGHVLGSLTGDYDNIIGTYSEAKMSLTLGQYLKTQLESYGFTVVMTRTTMYNASLELKDRGLMAKGCDFFISLHSNADSSTAQSAPQAYCSVDGKSDVIGQLLADCVASTMGTSQAGEQVNRLSDDMPGQDYYAVLRYAAKVGVSGVLMEHSYHTNSTSRQWLLQDSNLSKLATAEAKVIAKYFGLS